MIRLFVGIAIPPEIGGRLEVLESGIPGARWVAARNMHLTLRFLGEIEEGLAAELHDALAEIRAPAFSLALDGLGMFGSGRRAETLWAGVAKAPALVRLRDKVESTVVRGGLAPEPRKFAPHVTLARLKGAPASRLQDFLAAHNPWKAGPWEVDRFTLFRSHLGRSGAEYEALSEYELESPQIPSPSGRGPG